MLNLKPCLIIAGEKSGEEHVMSFLPELKKSLPDLELFGVGGEEMADEGVELLYHLKDFSSWGFSEVIQKIPFYFKALNRIVDEVKKRNCQTAILVDFQDFNMRLAKRLSKEGVKVLHYVAPQAWAWKAWRAKALQKSVHTLFTIIPFEKDWFLKRGVHQVKSVPHPLWFHYHRLIDDKKLGLEAKPFESLTEETKILCLPGSRNFEVKNLLPEFLQGIKRLKGKKKLGLVVSPNVNAALYRPYLKEFDEVFTHHDVSKALEWSHLALAASGTVTLTCALFHVPTVVCYSTSLFNEYIFYTFLNYQGPISLANIVHQQKVFPELLQESFTPYNIEKALNSFRENESLYEKTKEHLSRTRDLVGGELKDVGKYMADVIKEDHHDHG